MTFIIKDQGIRRVEGHDKPCLCIRPRLNLICMVPGATQLTYCDSERPGRTAKPRGAANLQVFVAVSDRPCKSPYDARFAKAVSRSPFVIEFTKKDNAKIATYFGRWATASGDVGPWSQPVSMAIAA